MATPNGLANDAYDLYKKGKYRDAALLSLQASALARELKDMAGWYEHQVWAMEFFRSAGEYAKAMDLLMDARLHEPVDSPCYAAWIGREKLVDILLAIRPDYARLNQFMQELREFAGQHREVQSADIHFLEADILSCQGRWTEALAEYQKAWQEHDEHKAGCLKFGIAHDAAECCLRLNQLQQAKDWLKAGDMLSSEFFKWEHIYYYNHYYNLELSLAEEAQPFSCLPALLRQLEEQTLLMQDRKSSDGCNRLAVRVALLTNPDLDPMRRHHPSRPPLMQRVRDVRNVHSQYQYRLLLTDVRLAALRFCAGIAPVDDLYYARPQQLPTQKDEPDMNQLRLRMQKALQSTRQAELYGAKIDAMLECDWRQKEVQERRRRIMEIAQYWAC